MFGTNRERGITLWTLFGTVESNQLTAKQETDTAKRNKASNNVATKRLWSNSELRLWGELLCNWRSNATKLLWNEDRTLQEHHRAGTHTQWCTAGTKCDGQQLELLSKLQTCEKAPTEPATTLKSQRPCVSAKGFIRELKSEPKEPEALCECKR